MSEETKVGYPTEGHFKRDPLTGEYEVEARFQPSEGMRILASLAYELLKASDAPNFVTFEVSTPEDIRLAITVQKMAYDAETPSSKLAKLTLENLALRKELEASRSPREDRNK